MPYFMRFSPEITSTNSLVVVWEWRLSKKPVVSWGGGSGELEDWSRDHDFLSLSPRHQFCLRRLEDKSTLY